MSCQVTIENGLPSKVHSTNGRESNLYKNLLDYYKGDSVTAFEKWADLNSNKDLLGLTNLDSNGEPIVNNNLYLDNDITTLLDFYANESNNRYADSKVVLNRVLKNLKVKYPKLANNIYPVKVPTGGGYAYKFDLKSDNVYYQLGNGQVKSGVEELFESNPELANAVYEALGFEIPTTKLQGKKKDSQGNIITFDVIEELTSNERKDLPESILLKKLFDGKYIPKTKNGDILLGSQYRMGSFSPGSNLIEVKGANKDIVSKILNHELLHSVTYNIIKNYQAYVGERTIESIEKDVKYKKINLTEKQINALNELTKLKNKVITYYKNNSDNIQDKYPDLGKSDYFIRTQYSEADLDEFISEVFSNRNLIEVLKQIPSEGKKSNLFKDFVDAIAKILGFTNTSILEDIVAYSEEAFFAQPQITPQQKQQALQLYSQYLDTIFPDSQVKDIVYHGSGVNIISREGWKTGKETGTGHRGVLGYYFSKYLLDAKIYAQRAGSPKATPESLLQQGYIVPTIVNAQNKTTETEVYDRFAEIRRWDENYAGFDTVTYGQGLDENKEVVVKSKEQIHILGTKQDIEGFKNYVQNKQSITPRQGISELFAENLQLASIGTQEQYERYLSTIFPDSKVRDIVYHKTPFIFDKFEKPLEERKLNKGNKSDAIFFSFENKGFFRKQEGAKTLTAIVNTVNNKVTNENIPYASGSKQDIKNILQEDFDSITVNKQGNNKELLVFEPEQIHILGGKQDIEGFQNFVNQNQFQQKQSNQKQPSDSKLNAKIKTLLEAIGVRVDYIENSRFKDTGALGVADMLAKVAYVSMNKSRIDTLPEEAAHFFVDYIEQIKDPLFNSMMYDIEKYDIFMETYQQYKNTYTKSDGSPDMYKIRKEAIGKMIAKIIVDRNNVNESQGLIDRFTRWLDKVLDKFKTQLAKIGLINEAAVENYFELAASNILEGKYQGEFNANNNYYNQQLLTESQRKNIANLKQSDSRWNKYSDEDIQRFIDSVFPNSKVKDIVYHGSPKMSKSNAAKLLSKQKFTEDEYNSFLNSKFDTFDFSKSGSQSNSGIKGAAFFTTNPKVASFSDNYIYQAILNITDNIQRVDYQNELIDLGHLKKLVDNSIDFDRKGLIIENVIDSFENDKNKLGTTIAVFKPEQIYILNSDKAISDMERFVNESAYFQLSNEQKKLDAIITKRNDEIRTVEKADGNDIKEILKDGVWQYIKRVSEVVKAKGKYYTQELTDVQKKASDNKAAFGTKVHNDMMILVNKALGKTDNRPLMLNSAYHAKMNRFIKAIIEEFNPDTHEYYTEVNIHNGKLAGTIDLIIIDSEGRANIFDYKTSTGIIDRPNIAKSYTDKWYEQLMQYRTILKDYGVTKFGQTRMIPINVNFSDKVTAKEGTDLVTEFQIGNNKYNDEEGFQNLNPVPSPDERTGITNIDKMISKIEDRIRQLSAKSDSESRYKVDELKRDIAKLQVSKNLDVIKNQAEIDLNIIKGLIKKSESESLTSEEIFNLLQLYDYYEDRLKENLVFDKDKKAIPEILETSGYVQEQKEVIDNILKAYNNTFEVTDEIIKPSSWWNRLYKLSDYDIPAFQGLYKLFNRIAAQKEIKVRKLKEEVKDIIAQIKTETGKSGVDMFLPILQKDKNGKPNGKLIAQKKAEWFTFVDDNQKGLYKNLDSFSMSHIKNTPLGQYVKLDELNEYFKTKLTEKAKSLNSSSDTYKVEALKRYKAFLISVTLGKANSKFYDTENANFDKFLNPEYVTYIRSNPNGGLAKIYKKIVELNQYANQHADADIRHTNLIPYVRKGTVRNFIDSGFNLRALRDNALDDLRTEEWESFELDSQGNKIYKVPLQYNTSESKRDVSQQSFDLGEVLVLWADAVYGNELLQNQHDTSLLFLEGLKRSKEYVTQNGKLVTKNGEYATKNTDFETIQQYIEYHNNFFYGQSSKDEDSELLGMSRRKAVKAVSKHFSATQLAINLFSGLSNLTGGLVGAYSYAGDEFKKSDYTKAQYQLTLKSIFDKDSKVYAAIKMFDVDSNVYDASNFKDVSVDKINKFFTWDKLYTLQKKGDWLLQNATLVAMSQNYTIKDNKIVKKTDGDKNLLELLEVNDKGQYRLPIANEEELFRFREKVRAVNSQIIGNTSEYDIQLAGNTLIGQLSLQFRRWMLPIGTSKFGSLKYNATLEKMTYGKYRSTGKLVWETMIKEKTLKPIFEFIKNTKNGKLDLWLLEKYNEDLKINPKLGSFDDYRNLYFRNMKATLMEATILLGIIGLKAGLKGDDDEEKEAWQKVLNRILSRTVAENSFWFNPNSFFEIVQSPIPMINFARNIYDVFTIPKDVYEAFILGEEDVFDNYDKFGKLIIGYNSWLSFMNEIEKDNE